MIRSGITAAAGSFMLALGAACATGGSAGSGGAEGAAGTPGPVPTDASVITVMNGSPRAVAITLYIMPEVGVDTPLGTVEAGQNKDFPFEGPPGRYRLRAVGSTGETVSDVFQLTRASQVRWDMALGRRAIVTPRR